MSKWEATALVSLAPWLEYCGVVESLESWLESYRWRVNGWKNIGWTLNSIALRLRPSFPTCFVLLSPSQNQNPVWLESFLNDNRRKAWLLHPWFPQPPSCDAATNKNIATSLGKESRFLPWTLRNIFVTKTKTQWVKRWTLSSEHSLCWVPSETLLV